MLSFVVSCLPKATEREDIRPQCPARIPHEPTSLLFCASAGGTASTILSAILRPARVHPEHRTRRKTSGGLERHSLTGHFETAPLAHGVRAEARLGEPSVLLHGGISQTPPRSLVPQCSFPTHTIASVVASQRTTRRSCCDTSDIRNVAVSMYASSVEHFGVPRLRMQLTQSTM